MDHIGEKLVGAAAAAVFGVVVGWAGSALTMTGRVSALEAGQNRIEGLLMQLVQQEKRK